MGGKRILLIIPELTMGGAQRSISKLSVELAREHQVWIVVFNRNHSAAYSYGGELLSLDVVPGSGIFSKAKAFAERVVRLKKIKTKLQIDVSISFLEGADYINVLARTGEKVVVSIRGSKLFDETIHGQFYWLRHKVLIPWLYQKADTIVTVNKGIAWELANHYGIKKAEVVVIGNYYDVDEMVLLSGEAKGPDIEKLYQDPVLITTGRLAPEKGLKQLVKVFARLKERMANARMIIVGDGPQFEDLVRLGKECSLVIIAQEEFDVAPDVLILRNQKNVFRLLKGATLYLMNSSSEGFPNGLAEAMICGVAVVSSDCPYGPREILEPNVSYSTELNKPHASEAGILMPIIKSEADVKIWSDTIARLLAHKDELARLSANARNRMTDYSKEKLMARWNDVLL